MLLVQIKYQLIMQFKVKFQDPFTLFVSFFIAPLLGLLTALIFYASDIFIDNSTYSLFIFFMLVASIFFGLVGSIFEIVKEFPIVKRQKLGNVSIFSYYIAKYLVLAFFGLIQVLLFVLISMWMLDAPFINYIYNFFIMYLLLLNSIALGLWLSSLVSSTFMATNLIPLIIVPQILLGGLIPYESMNKILYCGFDTEIPIVAKLVPLTYAYESAVTGHIAFNEEENINDSLIELINSNDGEFLSIYRDEMQCSEYIKPCEKTWFYDIIILFSYLMMIQLVGYLTLKRKLK